MRRTTATTDYLKECMGTALLELMDEKPIEKISIEEMTARADVGRSTYFRYFKSKDEVRSVKLVMLWTRFATEQGFESLNPGPSNRDVVLLFFEFLYSIKDINNKIRNAGHSEAILQAFLDILKLQERKDSFEVYTTSFIAYGLFGIGNSWMGRKYQESPEEMADIFMKLVKETHWGS